MKQLTITLLVALSMAVSARAQSSGTTTLSVTVAAAAQITVSTSNTSLTSSGTVFQPYTGTTTFSYKIRTSKSGGSGSVTVRITSEFSPTTGPDADDDLSFTCGGTGAGTKCSGSQDASTSTAKNAISFGADAHSANSGDTGTLSWSLQNQPQYETGSYSATATFTISAT